MAFRNRPTVRILALFVIFGLVAGAMWGSLGAVWNSANNDSGNNTTTTAASSGGNIFGGLLVLVGSVITIASISLALAAVGGHWIAIHGTTRKRRALTGFLAGLTGQILQALSFGYALASLSNTPQPFVTVAMGTAAWAIFVGAATAGSALVLAGPIRTQSPDPEPDPPTEPRPATEPPTKPKTTPDPNPDPEPTSNSKRDDPSPPTTQDSPHDPLIPGDFSK